LRVAVDVTPIPGRRVGAGVYVAELIRAMGPLDVDLHLFVNARDFEEFTSMAPNASLHPVRVPNRPARIAWAHAVLPLRVRRLHPDVFHGPHYTLPSGLPCASVVTFHDPTFFTLPEVHERSKVSYFTRAATTGIARATRVIAVSEYARRGAVDHAGGDARKIDVVYNGVDPLRYRPADGDGNTKFPFEPYILFVGALEPRKNVPALIAAYEDLARSGIPHQLVLAGPPAWGAAEVDAAVAGVRQGRVHRLSFVPEDQKIELLRRASLFVYPSIAEGFGLPVLEAMACGTPVVTTTGSAPEEIARDAALLVPPRDHSALKDAMARVLADPALAAELRRKGAERALAYTWSRAAEQTLDVYRRAAKGAL
jgi:glycosyltransferase involved in cell wall biosynthesis